MTQKFSPAELRKMKKVLEPYGAIKDCSDKTNIHRTTIARALKTGAASDAVVHKMRLYLNGFASRMFIEPGKAA